MTKESLAAQLTGASYPFNVPRILEEACRHAGLVIIYGASDDLLEIRGMISDEIPAFGGTTILIVSEGLWDDEECVVECRFFEAARLDAVKHGKTVTAVWNPGDDYSWRYETDIPHSTFEILEDGERYCRGIIFSMDEAFPL